MKLKYRFFLIFSALAVAPLLLFSYIAYTHYIQLSNAQIVSVSSNIMDQAVGESNAVFSDMQHILERVQYTSPNEDTILEELQKFSSPDSVYTDQDIYVTNRLMKYIFQNLISSIENINGIFIFTPSGVILGQGYGNGVDVLSSYDPSEDQWYQDTLNLQGKIYLDGVKSRDFLLNDTPSVSFSMCIYDVYSRDFLGVLYINCAPDILSIDSMELMPQATRFSIERAGDVLYQSANSASQGTSSETLTYTKELSFQGVTLCASFDKASLAADFRVTLSLMVAALLFFFVLFIVLY